MYVDELDIDHEPATDGDPGLPYPFDLDPPVDQNVKVGISVLLEFQDPNILWRAAMVSSQVNPQLRERVV